MNEYFDGEFEIKLDEDGVLTLPSKWNDILKKYEVLSFSEEEKPKKKNIFNFFTRFFTGDDFIPNKRYCFKPFKGEEELKYANKLTDEGKCKYFSKLKLIALRDESNNQIGINLSPENAGLTALVYGLVSTFGVELTK